MAEYDDKQELAEGRDTKKKSPAIKFFIALLITIGVILAAGAAVLAYLSGDASEPFKLVANMFVDVPEHTNFAILGFDEDGTRADVIIVGTFNAESEEAVFMSIPRDTYTVMPAERRDMLKEQGKYVPDSGEMKINAVPHYAGKENALPFTVSQLEELLDIEIDYYVRIDLAAFRFLVDEIGGVTFDVPQRMYYNDPDQNLYIDLEPGVQVLNGTQAEGLVRYRKSDMNNPVSEGYPMADLQRVKVQQDFIKAFIAQALTKKTIINNLPALLKTLDNYTETNLNVSDLGKYTKFALRFDTENIKTYTIPNSNKTINGVSYVYPSQDELAELVNQEFKSKITPSNDDSVATPADSTLVDSKDKRIQVLNGGYVTGLAGATRDKLNEMGYNVTSIGDYKGEKEAYTRIVVRMEGQGADLQEYFEDSKIVIDTQINENYDIIIVLGTE